MTRLARSIRGAVCDKTNTSFSRSIKQLHQACFPASFRVKSHRSLPSCICHCQLALPTIRIGETQRVSFSTASGDSKQSPFASNSTSSVQTKRPRKKLKFVPRKAAVALTPRARNFFRALLESTTADPEIVGIWLKYHQSSSGEPRMVFSFDFAKASQLSDQDEGVSLEVLEDGVTPKPPDESENDGLPKLYVHHNAFMKVLGCTLDVDQDNMMPLLYDREGNKMDPNA